MHCEEHQQDALREWERLPFQLRDHINEYADGKPRAVPLPARASTEGMADMTNWPLLLGRSQQVFSIPRSVEVELVVTMRDGPIGAVVDQESLVVVHAALLNLGAHVLRSTTLVQVRVQRRSRLVSPRLLPPLALGHSEPLPNEERATVGQWLKNTVYPDAAKAGTSRLPSLPATPRCRKHPTCSVREQGSGAQSVMNYSRDYQASSLDSIACAIRRHMIAQEWTQWPTSMQSSNGVDGTSAVTSSHSHRGALPLGVLCPGQMVGHREA